MKKVKESARPKEEVKTKSEILFFDDLE